MIAAIGNNLEMGLNNRLLCYLPEDLKRFKAITSGHPVIMGRSTWDSLPKKPLPHRRNIVISRNRDIAPCDYEIARSVEEVFSLIKEEEEAFIIGGASVYKQFIDKVQKLYLTRILSDFEADVFFPEIDFSKWTLINDEFFSKNEMNSYDMRFQYYELKK